MNYKKYTHIFVLFVIVAIIALGTYASSKLIGNIDNNSYVLRDLLSNELPVVNQEVMVDNVIRLPYHGTNVEVEVNYYSFDDDEEMQEKSLIIYDNTYIPNTGILYKSLESFEVIATFSGKVTNIKSDDVFGNIIELTYNNNMIARYSSVDNINVAIGDTVAIGEVLATSGINKVSTSSKYMLLYELIVNGTNVDPEDYYNKNIDEMSL